MKQLKASLLLIFFTSIAFSGYAKTDWKLASGTVEFKIKNAGVSVDGTIGGLTASISFDVVHPETGSIQASVQTNKLTTGIDKRDQHLFKEDYFDAQNFPEISMTCTKIITKSPGSYVGMFKLTIKNNTKEVAIPFTFLQTSGSATMKGSFEINRQDYKVGKSSVTLADKVVVSIVANLIK
jgi:polyisoprenoid-binding protein YceI